MHSPHSPIVSFLQFAVIIIVLNHSSHMNIICRNVCFHHCGLCSQIPYFLANYRKMLPFAHVMIYRIRKDYERKLFAVAVCNLSRSLIWAALVIWYSLLTSLFISYSDRLEKTEFVLWVVLLFAFLQRSIAITVYMCILHTAGQWHTFRDYGYCPQLSTFPCSISHCGVLR